MRFDDQELVRRRYACEKRFHARKRAHTELRQGVDAEEMIVAAVRTIAGRELAAGVSALPIPCRAASDQALFVATKAA